MKIYGVGSHLANQFYKEGCRTLEDVRKREDLTDAQKIGLKYFDDIQIRIPRDEVQDFEQRIQKVMEHMGIGLHGQVLGSYRRGAESCGDVDFILYQDYIHPDKEILDKVVADLLRQGILTEIISQSHKTIRAIGRIGQGTFRRVDLLLTTVEELGAAKIYFTGNDIFNRSLRYLADKKGMHLNEKGLFRGEECVASRTEEDIFDALGVPFRPPEERNA